MERRARLSSLILFSTCWSEINVPQRNSGKFTILLRREGDARFSPEEMNLGLAEEKKKKKLKKQKTSAFFFVSLEKNIFFFFSVVLRVLAERGIGVAAGCSGYSALACCFACVCVCMC